MIFSGKDGSNNIVKKVTSSLSMRKKKNTAPDQRDLRRSTSTGSNLGSRRLPSKKSVTCLNCETRKKPASVLPAPSQEKDGSPRLFLDDTESIWLSSDCTSPSFFLEEHRQSVSFHFKVDERVVSWLSNLANSSLSLDEGIVSFNRPQTSSRDEEPSTFPDITENAEKGIISPPRSLGNGGIDCFVDSPESIELSYGKSSHDLKSCENFLSTPNSSTLDSSPQVPEANKISSSTESEPDSLTSKSEVLSAYCCKDQKSLSETTADSKNCNGDEPLFWPFEQKFDWTSEDILKHFTMSPRRKKALSNAKKSTGTSPGSIRAQLHARKLDVKDGCMRKLVFNSGSKESKTPQLKRTPSSSNKNNIDKNDKDNNENRGKKNSVKRANSLPSRLRRSNKLPMKVVPLEITDETAKAAEEKAVETKPVRKFVPKSRTFLEDDFASMEELLSIETIVGLGEFNGREGIDSDFNGDFLVLDD